MTPYSLPLIAPAHLGTSSWLWRLRWFAVFGQLATILVAVIVANYPVPLYPLLALVAVTAISNASYGMWLRRAGQVAKQNDPRSPLDQDPLDDGAHDELMQFEIAEADKIATSLMMLDLITLTCMLYLSGGLDNPFALFYFVNLAVGGVILQPKFSWILALLAITATGLLILTAPKVAGLGVETSSDRLRVYHLGLFVAFTTCSLVVTYFVTRTAAVLTWRERQLRETHARHAQTLRLQGLTTLAAGAAHELATPLSTIDVITRELANHLQGQQISESVRQDLRLIDHQIDMCKQILRRMRGAAGDSMINQWNHTTVGDLIDCALEGVRDPDRVDVTDGPLELESQPLWIPQEAVAQSIRNLIHNGLDASPRQNRIVWKSRKSSIISKSAFMTAARG